MAAVKSNELRQTTIEIHRLTAAAWELKRTGDNPTDTEWVEIDAWVTDACPGLAIHPKHSSTGPVEDEWSVTHIASGHAIRAVFVDKKSAAAFVRSLTGLVNWELPREKLGEVLGEEGRRKYHAAVADCF